MKTIEQILEEFGGVADDWKPHPNGGGWVHRFAEVAPEAFIGPEAVVWGGTIWGGTIWGGTIWGGTIRGGTIWGGTIWGGTIRGGTIRGGTWNRAPLFVAGSRHPATNAKPGHLQIGCRCEPFAWWSTPEAEAFADDAGYTAAEKAEYRAIVELFQKIGV